LFAEHIEIPSFVILFVTLAFLCRIGIFCRFVIALLVVFDLG
jgi:hypothetical protein